ncbi:MAG: hypothetical protein M3Y48_24720 [Actinomycetota bacterium]|nr:hypothetical protein [Actinomycetota bacterium]
MDEQRSRPLGVGPRPAIRIGANLVNRLEEVKEHGCLGEVDAIETASAPRSRTSASPRCSASCSRANGRATMDTLAVTRIRARRLSRSRYGTLSSSTAVAREAVS